MKVKIALKWTVGVIAFVILIGIGAVVSLFVAFFVSMERGEEYQRQLRAEQRSGKWDFGDQPVVFAVAQGIVKNDPDAIRAAGKAVPDLQAPGRDGATLLYFAVTQSWQRPELTEAVRTLLSLGADPNYTNGKRNSFAMANAVHASASVLRTMLEAGGNPNTRDEFGRPIHILQLLAVLALACIPLDAQETYAAATAAAKPAFIFGGVGYLHRWSQNDQHEFTPEGQEDVEKWSDMITLNSRVLTSNLRRESRRQNECLAK